MFKMLASNITGRKVVNVFMLGICGIFILISVVILLVILGYTISKGLQYINFNFFTNLPKSPSDNTGGLGNALLGSLYMVGIATLISVSIGVVAGIHLSEFGRSKFSFIVRFLSEVLTGVPSIVVGIFVYVTIVRSLGTFSALAGGIALSIIMLPIITRSVEGILRMVPDDLREASLALGATPWKTTISVVIPSVSGGILTGVMLAVARAAGETAPLLFTALSSRFWPRGLMHSTPSLPVYIYNYATSPYDNWQQLAWAGALVLITLLLVTNILVKLIAKKYTAYRV